MGQLRLLFLLPLFLLFTACSVSHQLQRSAQKLVLSDSALQKAHVGISIYEPATGKWWYNWQGDKYFLPASNTKLATCYAAMKYLGDSLVGLRYGLVEEKGWNDRVVILDPTGDPTFLHPDYKQQPVADYLQSNSGKRLSLLVKRNDIPRWGSGWSWNDYEAAYMAERNSFPVFGNVVRLLLNDSVNRVYVDSFLVPGKRMVGKLLKAYPHYFDSLVNQFSKRISITNAASSSPKFDVKRSIAENRFSIIPSERTFATTEIPFVTNDAFTTLNILSEKFKRTPCIVVSNGKDQEFSWECDDNDITIFHIRRWNIIHSQPTDSLLRPMMHRSDNFFAEQSLLMVSNEMLGFMNDEKIIDTLLKTDFKDLPQPPRWVDGSGLSRYNLFTPQDFVAILTRMKNEFGMTRVREILPAGNEGTLTGYYKAGKPYFYGKTGTLSGVVALSGYLTTARGKDLIISVLVNNHRASATAVRRAVEKFLQNLREAH